MFTESVWIVSASSEQLIAPRIATLRANMPRKFDKARRARASLAEKTRELAVAIKNSDRTLARNLIFKDKIRIPIVTWQEFTRFLRVAVKARDAPLVRELLAARPRLGGSVGAELLWEVINDADTRISEMLVRAGADVNKSFDRYSTSLLHALAKSNDSRKLELAVMMMKLGANVAARDFDGFSVLEEAIMQGNHALARELLIRGAAVDEDVLWAVVDSRSPVESALLIVNGDHVKDATTRYQLVAGVFETLCSFDVDEDKLVHMTKAMFDLGIPDAVVILQAIRYKRIGVMKSLLHRTDIDERIKMSFLHCAAADQQSSEMARVLVEWGADIDYPLDLELGFYNRGIRPLHAACRYESLENIQLLLQLGADVNAKDDRGNTPFSCTNDDNLTPANRLVIKHFALMTSRGDAVNEDDLELIASSPILQEFYDECLSELQEMKEFELVNRISFYSILNDKAKTLVTFVRCKKFLNDYRDNVDFYPVYREDLDLRFREVEKLMTLLTPKEKALSQALRGIISDLPVEKIIQCMYLNEVENLTVEPLLGSSFY